MESESQRALRICVLGAGSVGCYVGGLLAGSGQDVRFLARARLVDAVARDGLHLTDYLGLDVCLRKLAFSTSPKTALENAGLVLVCVKSGDTAKAAQEIAKYAPDARVISLQNGVSNLATLRDALPGADARAAMVPFNVVPMGVSAFHRATSGDILVQTGPLPDLSTDHLRWKTHPDIVAVQWGKLLINLGNAINALSGITLLEQLESRAWRSLIADQMAEALRVLRVAGITAAKTTAVSPGLIPSILRLPTPIFRIIAAQMLTIDAHARSSMWDDLTKGRTTEIDALQGEILSLAARYGLRAPLNEKTLRLIKRAEAAAKGPPGLSVTDIRS